MLVSSADRRLRAAAGADDQLGVVRVYRRRGISVDRLAMHPLDEAAGRERPHARGVPGQAGVVEEAAPLAARAAAEERSGIDPVLRTAAGDGRAGPAAHRLERRRLDQAGPSVLVDVDAEARGHLPHLPLQVGLQVVVVHIHDVEIAGGVPERLQVLYRAPQRRPDLRRRRLVVDPLPEAVPLAVGARPRWPQWSELDTVDRGCPFALAEERAD